MTINTKGSIRLESILSSIQLVPVLCGGRVTSQCFTFLKCSLYIRVLSDHFDSIPESLKICECHS